MTVYVTVTERLRHQGAGKEGLGRLLGAKRPDTLQLKGSVVGPAVPPGFAGLEAANQHVVGVFGEVAPGVTVRRLVAASDVAARHAHPQVDPARADLQAFLAPGAIGHHLGRRIRDVSAVFVHWLSRLAMSRAIPFAHNPRYVKLALEPLYPAVGSPRGYLVAEAGP